MKQLDRFLRLERVRQDSEPELPAAPSRFSTLEEAPATGSAAAHVRPSLERFAPESAPAPELELELPDKAEPFVRCAHCGADSARHAAVCGQCEARLDTDEVRAFNVRLWTEMTAAREREAQDLREREALRRGSTRGPTAASDEVSAAELAAREQARRTLEMPFGRDSSSGWGRLSGVGPRVLPPLVAAALSLPVLFAFFRRGGVPGGWAAFLVALGAFALFAARRWR
jgi:hypothetical protein